MKKEVSQEELRVIQVLMRLDPDQFWPPIGSKVYWCGVPYHSDILREFPKCSRPKGHHGPHVAAVVSWNADVVKFAGNSKPWYEDEATKEKI